MTGLNGIQTAVSTVPAPAVEGDFASANPRWSALAGPGGYVAGASGIRIGYFCWESAQALDPDNNPTILNSFGSGPVTGFVHRAQQGLNTVFLSGASMTIPQGLPVTAASGGDFWVKNNGSGVALKGQKAYADLATGAATFAATATPTTVSTTGSIAASTFSVTGSIAGNVLNVTAVSSGTVVPGAAISGTGIPSGATIGTQLSGTTGAVGTYSVNGIGGEVTAASTTVSGTYGTMTITAGSGIKVGGLVTGSGVSAGTYITALGTGAGGTGTYIVNLTQTAGSTTLTITTNVETKWIAMSSAAAGELVKMSDHPLG